jgi:acyl CoA:acetate/3-ketoacid CoA transferase alpha subunit
LVEAFGRYTANNFSSVMAKNAKLTIVEASIVKKSYGTFDPTILFLSG